MGVRTAGGWLGWSAYVIVFALATGITISADPFEAAAADALAEDVIATSGQAAVTFRTDAQVGEALATADDAVVAAVDRLSSLRVTSATFAVGGERTRISANEKSGRAAVRVMSSDGALDAIRPIAGDLDAEGIWISERVSAELGGIGPGDTATLIDPFWIAPIPIAGVYEDIDLDDYGPFWSQVPQVLRPRLLRVFGDLVTPQILLTTEEFLLGLDGRVADPVGFAPSVRVWWRADSVDDVGGAAGLEQLGDDLRGLDLVLNDRGSPLGSDLAQAGARLVQMDTEIIELDARIADAREAIASGIVPVRIAGFVTAIAVVGVGALLVARRRRQELTMWLIDGRSPYRVGVGASLAVLPAAALGCAIGILVTPEVVALLGPSPETHRVVDLGLVAALLVVGVASVGVAVGGATARTLAPRTRSGWVAWIWEAAVYVTAGVLVGQVLLTDRAQASSPGLATILLPLVAVTAVVFGLLRLTAALARYVDRVGVRLPTGLFLSWRRVLAAARGRFVAATPIAVSIGIVVATAAMLTSIERGLDVKALTVTGSDTAVQLSRSTTLPPLPDQTTVVHRGSVGIGGSGRATLMVIDPATYENAVPWDDALGDSFETVVASLEGESDRLVPAVVVGGTVPESASMRIQRVSVPYVVDATLDAVPLMALIGPTIVISRSALEAWAEANPEDSGLATARLQDEDVRFTDLLVGLTPHVLSTRTAAELAAALGIDSASVSTRSAVLNQSEFTAQKWTYTYVLILAASAAVLAFITFAFLIAEQQHNRAVSDDLLGRMGATRRSRTAGLFLELGTVVLAAVTIGTAAGLLLSWLATAALDPLPKFAPALTAQQSGQDLAAVYIGAVVSVFVVAVATRTVARFTTTARVLREG